MSHQTQSPGMTPAQASLIEDLDDVAEHVAWEFDPDEYEGISTCGFARIRGLSGNGSFVRRVISAAKNANIHYVTEDRNGGYRIEGIGRIKLHLSKDHNGGYSLGITNVRAYRSGPSHQRLDVRQRLHRLVLDRLREHGYADDAWVWTRVD